MRPCLVAVQPHQQFDQGGFARARRPHEGDGLAPPGLEGHVLQGDSRGRRVPEADAGEIQFAEGPAFTGCAGRGSLGVAMMAEKLFSEACGLPIGVHHRSQFLQAGRR